jgi:hypothetical protein
MKILTVKLPKYPINTEGLLMAAVPDILRLFLPPGAFEEALIYP